MEQTNTTVIFSKMLHWQISVTLIVAIIALVLAGLHAGLSALAGGLSVILGALVASKIAERGDNNKEASAILVNLLKAEAVKILVIVVLLFLTFKAYQQLVPVALIAGLAASALFSGAAISKLNESEKSLSKDN